MSLTPTQLSELQTIVETLRTEFPNSDDDLWQAAIRIQKGGLGPVTGTGGQAAFDAAVADIVEEAEEISTVQGKQGGLGQSFDVAVFNVVPIEGELPAGSVGDVIYIDVAPTTYLATDVVSLTPAGPNSVILSEVGTQVARTVSAANGGLEVNNLNTGAGFERVLTTSDAGGGGTPGGADGNVQFNDAGAFGGSANLNWDDNTLDVTNTTSADPALRINVGNNPSSAIEITTTLNANYPALTMFDQTGSNFFRFRHSYNLSTPNHEFTLESSQFGTIWEIENEGNIYLGGTESTAILKLRLTAGNGEVVVDQGATFFIEETATAQAANAGEGQWWVLNAAPNRPVFADDTGIDLSIDSTLYDASHATARVTAELAGVATLRSVGNTDTEARQLQFTHQDGTQRGSMGHETGDALIIRNNIVDGNFEVFNENTFVGGQTALIQGNSELGLAIFAYDNEQVFSTIDFGIEVRGNSDEDGDPAVANQDQNAEIQFANFSGQFIGSLGYEITPNMIWRNQQRGGGFDTIMINSTGLIRSMMDSDPDGITRIWNPASNEDVMNTTTAAAGGLLVDNQSTGAGLERVLTTSDLGGGSVQELVAPNASVRASAENGGILQLRSDGNTTTEDRVMNLTLSNETIVGQVGYNAQSTLELYNLINTGFVEISADDTSDNKQLLIQLTPNTGQDQLYNYPEVGASINRLRLQSTGTVDIAGDLNNDTDTRLLTFSHQNGTRRGIVGHNNTTRFDFISEIHGANVLIGGEDVGGTLRTIVSADPDSATTVRGDTDLNLESAAGTEQMVLNSAGNLLLPGSITTGNNSPVNIDDGTDVLAISAAAGTTTFQPTGGMTVVDFNIGNVKFGGSIFLDERASALTTPAGQGQLWVETDAPNRLKFTDDTDQDWDVAMVGGYTGDNVRVNGSFNFNTAGNFAANRICYYDDGSNYTITTEGSGNQDQWPIHTSIQVIAPGSGTITIAEGTGTTLFDDTGTDLVGGCTVSQGVTTIYRASATNYIIWGSGITP